MEMKGARSNTGNFYWKGEAYKRVIVMWFVELPSRR